MRRGYIFVCSTAHIPEAERNALDRLIAGSPRNDEGRVIVEHLDLVIEPHQYGFFVHAGVARENSERPDSVSPELWTILHVCATAGGNWVLFDRDEPTTTLFPIF